MNNKPKLLLHSCCAPCSTSVIERLKNDYNITVYFYNPNILPEEEYIKRLNEEKKLLKIWNIKLIEEVYEPNKYLQLTSKNRSDKEGEQRCYLCYEMRIKKTAEYAIKNNFDFFTTTLSVSPYKKSEWINEIGKKLETENCKFLESNFKKQNGYLRSIQLSKEYSLYRQHYCGCTPPTTND